MEGVGLVAPCPDKLASCAPPAVPPEVYDDDYFLKVCAGSEEWRESAGAEASGVYEGLIGLAGLRPRDTLIDIGTGRGELLVAALDAGATRAVGVEYSESAVALARRTLAGRGAPGYADRTRRLLLHADGYGEWRWHLYGRRHARDDGTGCRHVYVVGDLQRR